MKTLSVKQVADVLGVSPRAVLKRLNNQQLKGTRRTNKYGVEEWWVYPNKEIRAAAEATGRADLLGNEIPTEAEIVDAETQSFAPSDDEDIEEPIEQAPDWRRDEMTRLEIIAEKLMKPLAEKLEAQAMALREKDMIIEDQSRQLKLLPDLEKRAEEERKQSELRALESEALKKQIAALQEQIQQAPAADVEKELQREKEEKESELARLRDELEQERKQKENEIKSLEEKLASVEEYKKVADEAQRKVDELQRIIEEAQQQESQKTSAIEEIKQLQEEKNAAVLQEVAALSAKLEKAQKPWWKKLLGVE